ncbi:D-alanyl-lipoteichoic acid biosynthesis protein DltD [Clostridium sardiniense]|uniref:D-alanyl-lipoteichoic acid biosynthesis protein DltD n=1 Tax=Clostridium sardiniense TaxID=29369 RepID=UPI003D328398
MKKLLYFIIPIFIGIIFIVGLNKFLDIKIGNLYKSKDITILKNEYSTNIKDKSVILADYFLSQNNIMMMGSSELNHVVSRQHPTNYFNTDRSKTQIFTIGRPYTQTLQDTIMLGSMNPNIKNKKIVLLLSMQWFMDKNGVTRAHFQSRFSPEQLYTFLDNKDISKKNKMEISDRVGELLKGSDEYKPERVYANLYDSNTMISKIESVILYPYFEVRKNMVKIKEKGLLYRALMKLPDKTLNKNREKKINWEKEKIEAVKEAKQKSNENNLKVYNDFYDVIKKQYKKLKNKYTNVNLMDSEEMKDYQSFLNLCENLNIKPTIVVIPASNWYYDYTGIPDKERYKYYDKVTEMAKAKGFDVMNLKDKENVDYYLRDAMHLGPVGWLDVNEKLYKKYNDGEMLNK